MPKQLELKTDIHVCFHTSYFDGVQAGFCWYKRKLFYFKEIAIKQYTYDLTEEEIAEAKEFYAKNGMEFEDEDRYEWAFIYKYGVYPFKTDMDAVKALANKAIWEEFIGFQNSHAGGFGPRFTADSRFHGVNRNHVQLINKKESFDAYMKSKPYQDLTNYKIDFDNMIGTFEDNEAVNVLISEGYILKEKSS